MKDPKYNLLDEVKIGDTIEATVIKTDDGAGNIQLSCKEAKDILSWDVLKQYMEEEKGKIPISCIHSHIPSHPIHQ